MTLSRRMRRAKGRKGRTGATGRADRTPAERDRLARLAADTGRRRKPGGNVRAYDGDAA